MLSTNVSIMKPSSDKTRNDELLKWNIFGNANASMMPSILELECENKSDALDVLLNHKRFRIIVRPGLNAYSITTVKKQHLKSV